MAPPNPSEHFCSTMKRGTIGGAHSIDEDEMKYDAEQLHLLEMETRRLCARYVQEIVLRFGLCPWAEPALRAKSTQTVVITDHFRSPSDLSSAARAVSTCLAQELDAPHELLLIVLPRTEITRLEMDELLRRVRSLDREAGGTGPSEAPFALAAFHPDASPDTASPERLIPYLRRSPDPMIQAVRTASLANIDPDRGAGTSYFDPLRMDIQTLSAPSPEPLRLRIARANLATCQEVGFEELETLVRSIMEDRRTSRTYIEARLHVDR